MYTYNATDAEKDHLRLLKETAVYAEKGVYDYIHALRRCYDTGAPYIGIFEDDILLADGWIVRTLRSLSQVSSVDGRCDESRYPAGVMTPADKTSMWNYRCQCLVT